ncbi:MAG: hypothetical protein QOG72_3314 [Sphingomonadales bacterium]|jgi:hypothetical protein|nr:hypothetical protein [Sphingomonadales bacterium]
MAKRDEEREKRLAEALRENLRRRKAQERREEEPRHPGESRDLGTSGLGGSPPGPGFRRDDG